MVREILKQNKIKITKARVKILNDILEKTSGISLKELEKNNSSINESTIYRTLNLFLEEHIICKDFANDTIVYKIWGNEEHYVECIVCHKKEKIDICPIENMNLGNFKILNHSIKIDGICENCNKQ